MPPSGDNVVEPPPNYHNARPAPPDDESHLYMSVMDGEDNNDYEKINTNKQWFREQFWSFVWKTLLDARPKPHEPADYGQIHIICGL